MAKTGIRHIAEKSVDTIDPAQKKNRKFEKERIGKSKMQNERKLPKAT